VTRCLNCGAERTEDECGSCGLDSSAAENALRRTFLNRTAIFLLGALAFVAASAQFPPLELDGMLIFFGCLFFITLGVGMLVERRAVRHLEVEAIKRAYYGLLPIPWLLGAMLLVNGALDHRPPQHWNARVIGTFAMFGPVPGRRLVVQSWREGRHFERVSVGRADFDRFHSGDSVEVHLGEGLLGIPWVAGVDRE